MAELVITGTISRIEHYGLYVTTPLGPAIILIPDVSSEPIRDMNAAFSIGQSVRLRLLHEVPEHGLYKGSMINVP